VRRRSARGRFEPPQAQVLEQLPGDGTEGDREQRPDDPGDDRPRRQEQEDRHWVQADGPADHERVEDVALELLDDEDHGHDDQRGDHALGHERHRRGHEPCDDRADEREERAEEGEHGEGERERDPDDGQRDADERRVDERDERHAAEVARDDAPAPAPELIDVGPAPLGELGDDEAPDPLPVVHEEEDEDEGEQKAGDELDHERGAGDHPPADHVAVLAQGRHGAVDRALDVRLADPERALGQEAADLVEPLAQPLAQLGELIEDGRGEQGDDPPEQEDGAEHRQQRGERAGDAPAAQEPRERHEEHRQEDRHDHRQHDEAQTDDDEAEDGQRGDEEQELQGEERDGTQPGPAEGGTLGRRQGAHSSGGHGRRGARPRRKLESFQGQVDSARSVLRSRRCRWSTFRSACAARACASRRRASPSCGRSRPRPTIPGSSSSSSGRGARG
jgi:hypothetical protein